MKKCQHIFNGVAVILLSATLVAAAGLAPMPERAPHGCYPVRLTVQTNADELILRLTNTVPDVSYLVMVRSNKPYAQWLPFTYIIGITNDHLDAFRISLKSGEAEGVMEQTALRHIPARVLSQMQFTTGSGEDEDGDSLPDLYEDLVTRTDPLSGNTGDIGVEDGYRDPDGDGWLNLQEFSSGTDPLQSNQPPGTAASSNHPAPPSWVFPARCDAEGIRQTIRQVGCVPATNGYALTVAKTVPRAGYLMLVREGKSGYWKASGFFVGSTNGSPVKLLADKRGMLPAGGSPYILPKVEHVPNLEHPEFICGSGEDADGDGLPDIYEVLATKTDPDKSDTGATGLLDGYKDLAGDGWTALEKYRRRADPFAPDHTPGQVELTEPTMRDAMKAFWQAGQYDFKYDVKVETRTLNPRTEYQDLRQSWILLFPQHQPDAVGTNLQIRITVAMPEKKAPPHHVGGP